MSHQLISRNPDLKRLRDEGYDIEIISRKYLLIKNVPYVNANKEIARGILVSELALAGDDTIQPNTHVAYFIGEHPCNVDGSLIEQIKHGSGRQQLDKDLTVDHSFSAKPKPQNVYKDYHHKMETYVAIISGPAEGIDPGITARIFAVIECSEDESVFKYADTASSRAGIDVVTRKLELGKIAIVGLGGTGAYVLDLVAKTPVTEIHLFDGDFFVNHNAFRSPGAPSIEQLRSRPLKVTYFRDMYSNMRRKIVAHECYLTATNINALDMMDFAFLCFDRPDAKEHVIGRLVQLGKHFIDVGMGVQLVNQSLVGVLRVTTCTTSKRDHLSQRLSFEEAFVKNEYGRNIQIADLNALNAALAVVKWKKLFGFYVDLEKEHFSAYTIDGNNLRNEDQ